MTACRICLHVEINSDSRGSDGSLSADQMIVTARAVLSKNRCFFKQMKKRITFVICTNITFVIACYICDMN